MFLCHVETLPPHYLTKPSCLGFSMGWGGVGLPTTVTGGILTGDVAIQELAGAWQGDAG